MVGILLRIFSRPSVVLAIVVVLGAGYAWVNYTSMRTRTYELHQDVLRLQREAKAARNDAERIKREAEATIEHERLAAERLVMRLETISDSGDVCLDAPVPQDLWER